MVSLMALLWRLHNALVIQPGKLRSIMRKQGIRGPPPTPLFGNISEIKKAWSAPANAPPFFDVPNKHDCATTSISCYEACLYYLWEIHKIFTSNGTQWAHQRKVISLELFVDKVKGMTKLIQESAMTIVNSWNKVIEEKGGMADIKVDPYIRRMSGDVISKTCFGSSYNKGEDIFSKLTSLEDLSKKTLHLRKPLLRSSWPLVFPG
ncbi:OLC1v1001607C1 [Oldenlandia corymbosa var. corymbosa]|uniref:OLC1v1001607C1 n=1 Tax=Oldenlandia corymbosa var. corymbosa TaxID=529605 RepID=A0AAV1D793_OLDCO|nr:OLC1v1001607C1 [Oldenlandia corymbosa var. corymbosa]